MSGPAALGVFNMSYEISNMPTTELVAPINRAVFPGYAKLKHDLQSMRAGYLKVVGIIALIALPAAAGIGVVAPLLVPVWLGDKWDQINPAHAGAGLFRRSHRHHDKCGLGVFGNGAAAQTGDVGRHVY